MDTMINNADAKLFYAQKLMANAEHELAEEILTFVAKNNPSLSDVQYLLGIAHFGTGKHEEAKAQLQKAIELDPDKEVYKTELENLELAIKGELPEQKAAAEAAAARAAEDAAAGVDTSQ